MFRAKVGQKPVEKYTKHISRAKIIPKCINGSEGIFAGTRSISKTNTLKRKNRK